MGGGSWTTKAYSTYCSLSGKTYDTITNTVLTASTSDGLASSSCQAFYKSTELDKALNPYNVMRECLDTEEHPNTIPIILGLDVTGSLGAASVEISKYLNKIMTSLYDKIKDVEFMIMGIGDVECDRSPIQISQFESDIRIAEQLDKIYFEFGGGGNPYESYTSAWYMGSRHTKLDCWKRDKKGIIITIGDERLNPMLKKDGLNLATGDNCQADVETVDLYKEASEKFNIYHIDVDHGHRWDNGIDTSWAMLKNNYKKANMNSVVDTIIDIILTSVNSMENNTSTEISW